MQTEDFVQTSEFELLVIEYQKLVRFDICYKTDSDFMHVLNVLVRWFCPEFMTDYTTVIGNAVYFPSQKFIKKDTDRAMRILAHEVVHLLDQQKWGKPIFIFAYLFPQILSLGILSFPWLGWWALLFLLFLSPIPSFTRIYFETRAYAMNLHTAYPNNRAVMLKTSVKYLTSWNYYKAAYSTQSVKRQILKWYQKAEKGTDKNLLKVLLIFELVRDK